MKASKTIKLAPLLALILSGWSLFQVSAGSAEAALSVSVAVPGFSLGINVPAYPELVPVPGYPVYYAPQLGLNYFFYDGLYWDLVGSQWYESSWYDGPWQPVSPDEVPLFLLRVPVRYYHRPPAYFYGWRADEPPHWAERWGRNWERRRGGWQHWDRRATPQPAPLPSYQRRFNGPQYPREVRQQYTIQSQHYHYQPREPLSRQRTGAQGGARPQPQLREWNHVPQEHRGEHEPGPRDEQHR